MRPFAFVLLLSLLPASVLAGPRSELTITVDKPIAVLIDGQMLEFEENSMAVKLIDVGPGRHQVEFRNFFGKLVGSGQIDFPLDGDAIARARWTGGKFQVYEIVPLAPEREVHEQVVVGAVVGVPMMGGAVVTTTGTTNTATVGVGVGTVGVGIGVGTVGLGGAVVTTGTTMTTTSTTVTTGMVGGTTGVVVVQEAPRARSQPVIRKVTFRSTDGEWGSVYVDGKRVWEIRAGAQEKSITLMSGEHTVEIKDFMENECWCKGTLVVSYDRDLTIGLTKEQPPEVFNDSGAFLGCR